MSLSRKQKVNKCYKLRPLIAYLILKPGHYILVDYRCISHEDHSLDVYDDILFKLFKKKEYY